MAEATLPTSGKETLEASPTVGLRNYDRNMALLQLEQLRVSSAQVSNATEVGGEPISDREARYEVCKAPGSRSSPKPPSEGTDHMKKGEEFLEAK